MRTELLNWYKKHRRVLPWREDPTPFHVWVSEIMLQQTRVEAVRPYYERFLKVLPDIRSLAEAPEDVYLKLWEGLGYYSRIRNMHKAAVLIMEKYGGQMPRTKDALLALPGIGPYTAAAIASIAFQEPCPAVDGNLLRIYARIHSSAADMKTEKARKEAENYYLDLMSGDPRPGDINQALMDLGATVCLPNGAPLCGECPLRDVCTSHAEGRETEFPVMSAKKPRRIEERSVFLIRVGGDILLRKRPEKGLLAGLYEFPGEDGFLSEEELLSALREKGIGPVRIREAGEAVHVFTHIEWHMRGWEIFAEEIPADVLDGEKLMPVNTAGIRDTYALPSAFSFYTKYVLAAL